MTVLRTSEGLANPVVEKGESEECAGHPAPLPNGIIAIETIHYRVGPYTYTNFADAMSQHRRNLAAKDIDSEQSIV